jgi:hypothetical protein
VSWKEKVFGLKDRNPTEISGSKKIEYDNARETGIPRLEREWESVDTKVGGKPIDPIHFQEVIGPKIFEGEYGVKGEDIIFHLWPYGYQQSMDDNKFPPKFHKNFKDQLGKSLTKVFTTNTVDQENHQSTMGSIYVCIRGGASGMFYKQKCIDFCEDLFLNLGGKA